MFERKLNTTDGEVTTDSKRALKWMDEGYEI